MSTIFWRCYKVFWVRMRFRRSLLFGKLGFLYSKSLIKLCRNVRNKSRYHQIGFLCRCLCPVRQHLTTLQDYLRIIHIALQDFNKSALSIQKSGAACINMRERLRVVVRVETSVSKKNLSHSWVLWTTAEVTDKKIEKYEKSSLRAL